MSDLFSQQKAIADIEFLKRAVLATPKESQIGAASISTHLFLNALSLSMGAFTLVYELCTRALTTDILASRTQPDLQISGLLNVAALLMVIIIGAYIIVKERAKKENSSLSEFAFRHFIYYRNYSILADMFVKFCLFSMIILAGKPEWVSAILVLFTGDLAIHGRHFYLPLKQSTLISVLSFTLALGMMVIGLSNMSIALGVFCTINAISLLNLAHAYHKIIKG